MAFSYNSGAAPSNANPYASASLYVGDLATDVTEATLFELFNAVGPVASIRVCRDAQTRRSLGYAYVNFHSVQDAERALDTMNFTTIRKRPCRIMWSQRDPALRKSGKGNIFVKYLHESIDNKTLYDTFSVFGNILSCKVMRDEEGKSLGYGYVHYVNEEDAAKAIAGVNGMLISERQVVAEPFKSREEREEQRQFNNVYVKYIPNDWTKEKLQKLFEDETGGTITSSYFKETQYGNFACLNFDKSEHAKLAVTKLNNYDTGEDNPRKLYVARAQKRAQRQRYLSQRQRGQRNSQQRGGSRTYQGVNLYVKNLSPDVTDAKLTEYFKDYGPITSARVMVDKQTNKSRGFGFVCFEKKEDAVRAMTEMNSKIIDGKPLYVSRAQRKAARAVWLARQRSRMSYPQQPVNFFPGQMQRPMPPNQFMPGFRPPYPQRPGPMLNQQIYPPMMATTMRQPYIGGHQLQAYQQQMRRPVQHMPMSYPHVIPQQPTSYTNPQVAPAPVSGTSVPQPVQHPPQQMSSAPQMPQMSMGGGANQQRPLTAAMLASVKAGEQKRLIGERIFPRIQAVEPRLAGKITGMLLEMENTELLLLLESQENLMAKINEALEVLKQHQKQSASNTGPVE